MQFIFSTALDGKIKAWLYDNVGSRVDYDAPGQWCTTMLYSADGSRYIYTSYLNVIVEISEHFVVDDFSGYFLVERAKRETLSLWSGMRAKVP